MIRTTFPMRVRTRSCRRTDAYVRSSQIGMTLTDTDRRVLTWRVHLSNRACSVGEFFKGWRRKAGLVTLAMACLLAVGWMRSYVVEDRLAFTNGDFRHAISSFQGNVGWDHWLNSPPVDGFGWSSGWRNLNAPISPRPTYYRAPPGSPLGQLQFESRAVPYWPFVVPLTPLSAWLILGKPRKAKGG